MQISLVLQCVIVIVSSNSLLINALDNEGSSETTTIFICSGIHLSNEKLTVPKNFMNDKKSYTFSLKNSSKQLDCPVHERFSQYVNISDTNGAIMFTQSGVIVATREENFVVHRNVTEYCVLGFPENSTLTLSICDVPCEKGMYNDRPCINKCCPLHKILRYDSTGSLACLDLENNTSWEPTFFRDLYTPLSPKEQTAIQPHYYSFDFDDCETNSLYVHFHKHFQGEYHEDTNPRIFRLLLNGTLAFCSSRGNWVLMDNENFCMDGIQNFGVGNDSTGNLVSHAVFRCHNSLNVSKTSDYVRAREYALTAIVYYIMIPFDVCLLLIVIVVYVLLWEKQNIHGYTILSYVTTLFFLYLTLSISVSLPKQTKLCKTVGVILHFLFIATFCWLTALSFDIWWTFRHLKACSESKNIRKYLMYVTFSFMIPALIISLGLAIDNSNKIPCSVSDYEFRLLGPNYGESVCGVRSKAQGMFLYLPAGILLGCNALFFALTVLTVHKYRQSTDLALQGKCTKEDKPIWIFFKLFIVMGVCWILEFIAWGVREEHDPHQKTSLIWVIWFLDVVNLIQPMAIFYIFVCKRVIYVQLWQNHIWLRSLLRVCLLTGCCDLPPEKRPSFMTSPQSTLVRSRGSDWSAASMKMSIRRNDSFQKTRKVSISAIATDV